MRENYEISIHGKKVILVPYRKKFVLKYHEWMKSSYLLEMTGSEPLSLEEEYEMQQSWRDDEKKCTFIILAKDPEINEEPNSDKEEGKEKSAEKETIDDDDEISHMIGDVNLFLSEDYEDGSLQAEIDIMIAEEAYRRSGRGKEAVLLMMWYGSHYLQIKKFFSKIKQENTSSIKLFEK
jgi:RimJ/RimL family protein N-acetyltransferase